MYFSMQSQPSKVSKSDVWCTDLIATDHSLQCKVFFSVDILDQVNMRKSSCGIDFSTMSSWYSATLHLLKVTTMTRSVHVYPPRWTPCLSACDYQPVPVPQRQWNQNMCIYIWDSPSLAHRRCYWSPQTSASRALVRLDAAKITDRQIDNSIARQLLSF